MTLYAFWKPVNRGSRNSKNILLHLTITMAEPNQHYEVIIAGGGIAGVTLALMFEKLGISYFLLEGRDTLESDRGAGIGLQPNGLRVLDQLGLVEDIEEATIPLEKWFSYDSEGNLMNDSDAMGQYRDKLV